MSLFQSWICLCVVSLMNLTQTLKLVSFTIFSRLKLLLLLIVYLPR